MKLGSFKSYEVGAHAYIIVWVKKPVLIGYLTAPTGCTENRLQPIVTGFWRFSHGPVRFLDSLLY
jgi:hypothetical protein